MQDEALILDVRERLFQPDTGLYIAPIRHHSPACAWAVRAMIEDIKPTRVLIEAPHDLAHLIPHLLDPDTVPPVAIASLLDQRHGPRLSAYYPFCGHSPEWVAIQAAAEVGAKIEFIDLGSDAKLEHIPDGQSGPRALVQDHGFDGGDYVHALCERLGCRDGFELWDHLFETRLAETDWRGFLRDVGVYCAGLRAATPQDKLATDDTLAREAHMAACIQDALSDTDAGPVVCVVGGFHAAPLMSPETTGAKTKPRPSSDARSYLIRYGYKDLDALMGYGAGLPQPAYYQALWDHAEVSKTTPDWPVLAHGIIADFVAEMRQAGHSVSVPEQVELLRGSQTLARLRGRPGVLRYDLFDGLSSALLKGEASGADVWHERFALFLRGNGMGDVGPAAGQPPIVADARTTARRLRFNIEDSQSREKKLDIRRKPNHLAASRFAHAMSILETGFALRTGGPDFLTGTQTGLLFEHWDYVWSPNVERQLIEAATFGDTVPTACLAKIIAQRKALTDHGHADDLTALIDLFKTGLLAGLGAELTEFLDEISSAVLRSASFTDTAHAMLALHAIKASRGPLALPEDLSIEPVMQQAFSRMIYLCDDLSTLSGDAIGPCLEALGLLTELMRRPNADMDNERFEAALDRVIDAGPAPELMGAITAMSVQSGRKPDHELSDLLVAQFNGSSLDIPARFAGIKGVMAVAPSLLWTVSGVLQALDDFVNSVDEDGFLVLLPHLRLAFAALSPREADQIAEVLMTRHGGTIRDFTTHHYDITPQQVATGAALEATLREQLRVDGLEAWISGANHD